MKNVRDSLTKNATGFCQFSTPHGVESFFALEAPIGLTFTQSIQVLMERYQKLKEQSHLDETTEIFLRFHLSDITNQAHILIDELKQKKLSSLVSMVGQAPASGSKVAIEAYHIKSKKGISKQRLDNELVVTHGNYQSIWVICRPQSHTSSYRQTQQLFNQLNKKLHTHQVTLENNVIRTWIYLRDVDNSYQGMVDARRELFEKAGLTKETHFIASTGIEGCGENVTDFVVMDSLAVKGLTSKQITYMDALDNLCPTHEYNVTFERATRVMYQDRAHYYISGTASIDREGNVLHLGDIEKQTERTLINIQSLLNNYSAQMTDLKTLTVYLRDVADAPIVQTILKNNLPKGIPYIVVKGSVCRPEWLIEIEGIAATSENQEEFDPFC